MIDAARNVRCSSLSRSLVVALGLFLIAGVASAECVASGCFNVYVEEIYPEATGGAWIQTSGNETLANCSADSGVYLRLDATVGYKEIYATLLAAQLTDKKVSIRVNEGSTSCTIAYVTLNRNTW
jgi:hypothetical protein